LVSVLYSNFATTTIATIETAMSEPKKKKKNWAFVVVLVTLVVGGLTGFGYYLDPQCFLEAPLVTL